MTITTLPVQSQTDIPTFRAALRDAARKGPLAIDPETGILSLLHHGHVRQALLDPKLNGVGVAHFDAMGIPDGPLRQWYAGIMFALDGAPHHRLRRLVSRAFTPRAVAGLRPMAAGLIDGRLAPLKADGGGDLVAALHDVPLAVMCALLGVPAADVPRFLAWVDALTPTFAFMTPVQIAAASEAVTELLEYCIELRQKRVANPAEDLITALIAAEDNGDRLTAEETAAMIANMLVAGHDTTASQSILSALTLMQHPEAMAALRADPSLLESMAEEVIRFDPSIIAAGRVPETDYEIAGHCFPAGTIIFCTGLTGNRDSAVWHQPDRFIPERFQAADAPKMLSFGAGGHFCLGAWLARVTLQEMVRGISAVAPRLAVDPDSLEWIAPLGQYPRALPVVVGAA
jgi:cytochrome P450